MLSSLLLDLRSALRGYLKQPGFTVAAVLMLALGIGANTAIFSVAHGVLLKPLGYPESERLVALWPETSVNKLIAATLEERGAEAFAAVSAYAGRDFPLTGAGEPTVVAGAQVGTRHFAVLGVSPLLGRTFTPDESSPGRSRVAVLGHGLWQRRFGGDVGVLGRTVEIDGLAHEVVGVMPPRFEPLQQSREIWTPLPIDAADPADYFGSFYLEVVARLRPGVSLAQANTHLQALTAELRADFPNLMTDEKVDGARAVPLHGHLVGRVGPTLLVLLGAVGVVLLIACANVANLILSRAAGRRRETALRAALGARPLRIAQSVLLESVVLGVAGGAAGLLLALGTLRVLVAYLPASVPRTQEIGIDLSVLGFAAALSLAAAVVFGLAPLRQALKLQLHDAIKEEGTASTGRRGRRAGQALVVAQIAAATVLLVGAALLLKSLSRLQSVDPGLEAERLYTVRTDLVGPRYPGATDRIAYYQRVTERVAALPGVRQVGAIHLLPLTADNWSFPYVAPDNPVGSGDGRMVTLPSADFRIVTPEYFAAAGIPVLMGRPFQITDAADAPAVGVINRTMAEELWPGADPTGRTIRLFGDGGPEFTVVGVVGDVHEHRLDQPAKPAMYRPFAQWPNGSMYLMVRTAGDPAPLAASIRSAIAEVDPQVPISQAREMTEVVRTSVSDDRFTTLLIGAFAVIALLLAASGAHSVISYAVARRSREMAIRVALGARGRDVFWQVMREGLALTAVGLVLGGVAALAANRALASRLFEVSTVDPAAFVLTGLVIGAAALLSYWLPAARAMRADPTLALRAE